jgi:hypothetical protein
MNNRRMLVLVSVAAILCLVAVWNIISGWGLVTVHVREVPLPKVIASIQSQSGAVIETNADAALTVSMDVDRVTPAEAVAVLSDRIDANWRIIYVLAQNAPAIAPAIEALKAGERRPKDWKTFSAGGRQGFMNAASEVIPDPRDIQWNISPMDEKKLQSFLDQFSQKTGVTALVPEAWNPDILKTPKNGKARSAVPALAKAAGGSSKELFFISKGGGRPQDGERTAGDQPPGDFGGDAGGGPPRRGAPADGNADAGKTRSEANTEWAKERLEAQIALLPKSEQAAARADQEMMQKTFQELRNLPPDQRQAKMEQVMNDPAVQDRMAAAQERRESSRSPEQRANRYRGYVERKQAAKSGVQAKP